MAKRSNHEGSVYRRSDGLWVGSVRLGTRRVYRYGKSRSEAGRKLQEVLSEHRQGTLVQPTKLTLQEWVDQWLQALQIRPSSRRTYRQTVSLVVSPIGHERLGRLTPAMLSHSFGQLARQGRGARQLHLGYGFLKACLDEAVRLELLARNPLAKVRRPKWEPRRRTYWTVDQAVTFLKTCDASDRRLAPLCALLVTSGLRISEALALTWADVDLDSRSLKVHRALVWSGMTYVIGAPKTTAAYRTVSLPDAAVRAVSAVAKTGDAGDRIFVTANGTPPTLTNIRRSLHAICRQAQVPVINVHGLRHVAAALAFRATSDPHAVQRRLGHSHISVTLGIYSYATRPDSDVADAVGKLLEGEHGAQGL